MNQIQDQQIIREVIGYIKIYLTHLYFLGESSPGLAAQLGMGFGISIISILLIVEIIYLYRKYRMARSSRQSDYEMPSTNRRLSD